MAALRFTGMRHRAGDSVPAGSCRSMKQTLRALVRRQIEAGINFLVPCGTTGESPTLTRAEHLRVVEITVEEAAGRVPGAGRRGRLQHRRSDRTRPGAGSHGRRRLLSVTPYYNKPTQEGLYQHYKAIAEAVSIPIVVYSVQGRTGVNVEPATLRRLAEIDNIVGVKEASGNIAPDRRDSARRRRSASRCSPATTPSRCR